MYRNDGVVVFEKVALKFGFVKMGSFNKIPFLHKAFHGDFWKRITSFLSPGQTCVCLEYPTLALSRTMGAFVL